jgi:hypothetical protein
MPDPPRRLPEIVQAMLAERGWGTSPSIPDLRPASSDTSQLVFVGNWQDPCPRRLLFDRDLEPVDKVTWQVIRVHADASKLVAFPSYSELMRAANVARATVARALAVLRLTRWLPLCAALRDSQGRFAGHVYALNDEPLPLPEMLAIDAAYVPFVEQARQHRSTHVRMLACKVFDAIQDQAAARGAGSLSPARLGDHLGERLTNLIGLLKGASSPSLPARDRVQNLNAADPVQNLNADRSSSRLKKVTTTTAALTEQPGPTDPGPDSPPLEFPAELSLTDSQRRVLWIRLEQVPAALRQDILDEAAGRIRAKRSTADPVRCEFDYLARLCVKALDGDFVFTDAGEALRRKRAERAGAEDRLRRAKAYSEAQRLKQLEAHKAEQGQGEPDSTRNRDRR